MIDIYTIVREGYRLTQVTTRCQIISGTRQQQYSPFARQLSLAYIWLFPPELSCFTFHQLVLLQQCTFPTWQGYQLRFLLIMVTQHCNVTINNKCAAGVTMSDVTTNGSAAIW